MHKIISHALSSVRIMVDGIEIRFLETFSNLFTAVFMNSDYKVDFKEKNANSQLEIEGQMAKLKKHDLIDFSALLLAISTGQISASCKVFHKVVDRRIVNYTKESTVYFGVDKPGKVHVEFTEFGWKMIVASHFQFALAQYSARFKLFTGYVEMLHRIYNEKYAAKVPEKRNLAEEDEENQGYRGQGTMRKLRLSFEEEDAKKQELEQFCENLKSRFSNLISCDVLSKLLERQTDNADHIAMFFNTLNHYGSGITRGLEWIKISFVANSNHINGASLSPNSEEDREKNEIFLHAFAICLMAYKQPIDIAWPDIEKVKLGWKPVYSNANPLNCFKQVKHHELGFSTKAFELFMSMAGEIAGHESSNTESEEEKTTYLNTCF